MKTNISLAEFSVIKEYAIHPAVPFLRADKRIYTATGDRINTNVN
jgi:hypothetical protein